MIKQTGFEKLDAAFARDSADYLRAYAPHIYNAVKAAVENDKTPEAIYWHVLECVGPYREAIAKRAQQAAEHFRSEGSDE